LFWSRQTLICLMLLCFAAVAITAWSMRRERTPANFVEQVFLTIYVAFLLPMFCLSFGTAGIASDVENRTLVYLLVTPLPRPLIFAAKAIASLLMSLTWTLGSLVVLSRLARAPGREALPVIWEAVLWSTVAYVALFQLFSVSFRRATILALAYAIFLETLIGNMPGIVKRLTVSYYTRCLIFEGAVGLGVDASGPFDRDLFLPIPGETAQFVLWLITAGLWLAGLLVFTFREYSK
jgi:ABC-type transport system involved in multi-copper enzyme maturation permease subunit